MTCTVIEILTLVGKKVRIILTDNTTIVLSVRSIISAEEALKNPEINRGAKNDLLYVIEGVVESALGDVHIQGALKLLDGGKPIQVYIYPSTLVNILN